MHAKKTTSIKCYGKLQVHRRKCAYEIEKYTTNSLECIDVFVVRKNSVTSSSMEEIECMGDGIIL